MLILMDSSRLNWLTLNEKPYGLIHPVALLYLLHSLHVCPHSLAIPLILVNDPFANYKIIGISHDALFILL